ncbi:hypothetical protein SHELI_v1c01010 [Spiroplasma helicoides]|uniref:Xaa-Pro dipeptidyl-peptidase-like domain-containing protein n=1 Tax=Spiroplasma helicoides TaxID=216938 RepID=A0A1B3SJE3_9MOLU|nr:alpha/beta fold hydrolase [Spiroplasma helicoides]AOG60056.1 hypothetical protein SHELI_v1c01010 [Spiroplasma helicoides]
MDKKYKKKDTLLNKIKKGFRSFYRNLEKPFEPPKHQVKKLRPEVRSFVRTNNICRRYYKRPELCIEDLENIQKFSFEARDGIKLAGYTYKPHKNSNKWLIAAHWFASYKNWALHHAKTFIKMGYNVLVFDFRGHGESTETTTTMGAREINDLMGAVDWLKQNEVIDSLSFMGTSMGAFCVNYCSLKYAKELKNVNFKFVVSDCTYGSVFRLLMHVKNIYLWFIRKRKTKQFVKRFIEKHNKKETDVDLNEASVFQLLRDGYKAQYPTLFFHSKDDKVTPPTDTYELLLHRSKNFNEDQWQVYYYAMHTQSIRMHFKTYNYKLAEFIAQQDNNWEDFNKLVDEWSLLDYDKLDRLSIELK